MVVADFATTLHEPLREEWVRRGACLTADQPTPVVRLARILAAARKRPLLVLDGSNVVDQVAAGVLARRRNGPTIILTDCTWKRGTSLVDRLTTAAGVASLRGKNVVLCVSSTEEVAIFSRNWRVDPSRIRVLRWYHGLTDEQLAHAPSHDGPVFTGGRSLRDYRALLSCAPSLSRPVVIAAPEPALPRGVPIPRNVRVTTLSHEEFLAAMRDACVVVVPLDSVPDRSAGQTTYLNAMAMGKLTIVTDTVGVREHVEGGITGLVVAPEDPDALERAIDWALNPVNAAAVNAIRLHARNRARTDFGPVSHFSALLKIVDEALGQRPGQC